MPKKVFSACKPCIKIIGKGSVYMKYTKLGNSDLQVSRICMGCMGFGDAKRGQHSWTLDEEHSREIIKRGLELGVNFFDTAIAYQSGTSEQLSLIHIFLFCFLYQFKNLFRTLP